MEKKNNIYGNEEINNTFLQNSFYDDTNNFFDNNEDTNEEYEKEEYEEPKFGFSNIINYEDYNKKKIIEDFSIGLLGKVSDKENIVRANFDFFNRKLNVDYFFDLICSSKFSQAIEYFELFESNIKYSEYFDQYVLILLTIAKLDLISDLALNGIENITFNKHSNRFFQILKKKNVETVADSTVTKIVLDEYNCKMNEKTFEKIAQETIEKLWKIFSKISNFFSISCLDDVNNDLKQTNENFKEVLKSKKKVRPKLKKIKEKRKIQDIKSTEGELLINHFLVTKTMILEEPILDVINPFCNDENLFLVVCFSDVIVYRLNYDLDNEKIELARVKKYSIKEKRNKSYLRMGQKQWTCSRFFKNRQILVHGIQNQINCVQLKYLKGGNITYTKNGNGIILENSQIQKASFHPYNLNIIIAFLTNGKLMFIFLESLKEVVVQSFHNHHQFQVQVRHFEIIKIKSYSILVILYEDGYFCFRKIEKIFENTQIEKSIEDVLKNYPLLHEGKLRISVGSRYSLPEMFDYYLVNKKLFIIFLFQTQMYFKKFEIEEKKIEEKDKIDFLSHELIPEINEDVEHFRRISIKKTSTENLSNDFKFCILSNARIFFFEFKNDELILGEVFKRYSMKNTLEEDFFFRRSGKYSNKEILEICHKNYEYKMDWRKEKFMFFAKNGKFVIFVKKK